MIIDKKIKTRGVTLIELLVAISIFSIFIAAISGLYISAIRAQQKILATQELLNQASYIIEYIGRALRMAVKEDEINATCLIYGAVSDTGADYWVQPEVGDIYKTGGTGIRFLESTDNGNICEEFHLDINTLKVKRSNNDTNAFGSDLPLTSSDITVSSFNVKVSGDYPANNPSTDPNLQPKVTIFLGLKGKRTSLGQPIVRVQTTISQRNLDVEQ